MVQHPGASTSPPAPARTSYGADESHNEEYKSVSGNNLSGAVERPACDGALR